MGNYNSTFTMNLPLLKENANVTWTPDLTKNFNKSIKKSTFKCVLLSNVVFLILTPTGLILQSKQFGAETIMIDYKDIVRLRGDDTNFQILTNKEEYMLKQTESKEIIKNIKLACLFISRN